jgi:hypothetical protein
LNPVKEKGMTGKSPEELVAKLTDYPWSTYQSYIGIRPEKKFVDYKPMLSLMEGRKSEKAASYRQFVESGIAADDEEFLGDMVRSARSIGSAEYREWVDDCYKELVEKREQKEDVSFRRVVRQVPVDMILEEVAKVAGCGKEHLTTRRRDSSWRGVAGLLLCKYGGMTQREAARKLGLKCGSAVSVQVRKLRAKVAKDNKLSTALDRLDRKLAAKQC